MYTMTSCQQNLYRLLFLISSAGLVFCMITMINGSPNYQLPFYFGFFVFTTNFYALVVFVLGILVVLIRLVWLSLRNRWVYINGTIESVWITNVKNDLKGHHVQHYWAYVGYEIVSSKQASDPLNNKDGELDSFTEETEEPSLSSSSSSLGDYGPGRSSDDDSISDRLCWKEMEISMASYQSFVENGIITVPLKLLPNQPESSVVHVDVQKFQRDTFITLLIGSIILLGPFFYVGIIIPLNTFCVMDGSTKSNKFPCGGYPTMRYVFMAYFALPWFCLGSCFFGCLHGGSNSTQDSTNERYGIYTLKRTTINKENENENDPSSKKRLNVKKDNKKKLNSASTGNATIV